MFQKNSNVSNVAMTLEKLWQILTFADDSFSSMIKSTLAIQHNWDQNCWSTTSAWVLSLMPFNLAYRKWWISQMVGTFIRICFARALAQTKILARSFSLLFEFSKLSFVFPMYALITKIKCASVCARKARDCDPINFRWLSGLQTKN